jgi:hypothetical protein
MNKLKSINFLATTKPGPELALLAYCWSCDFGFDQTEEMLLELGYYLPEDQWNVYGKLIDMQIDLDIGNRIGEREI